MKNLTLARGEDGIAVITWDMPGRSMNVMNDASMAEFASAVDQALSDPETKVGLFPGFGGTQRYLCMLGALDALPVLLEGTSLSPAQALARGLVD